MLDDISKLATCNICVIASALRVCDNCNFRQPWKDLPALILLIPPDPPGLMDMTPEQQAKWFKDLPLIEF